jgi:hypothetical protein
MFRNVFVVLFSLFCLSASAFSAEVKIPGFDSKKHFYPINSTWKSFLTDAQIAAINQKLVDLKEPAYLIEYAAGPRTQYEAEWFRGKVLAQWKKRGFNDAEWSLVIVGHHPDTLVVSVPTMLGKNFRPVADSSATTFQAKALGYLTDMSNHVAAKKAEAKAESDRIAAEAEAKVAREKKERDEAESRLRAVSILTFEQESFLSWLVFNESVLHDMTRTLFDKVRNVSHTDILSVLTLSAEVMKHLTAVRKEKELKSQQVTRWILSILGGLAFVGLISVLILRGRRAVTNGRGFHQRLGEIHGRVHGLSVQTIDGKNKDRFAGTTKKGVDELRKQVNDLMNISFVSPVDFEILAEVTARTDEIEAVVRNSSAGFDIDLRTQSDHWFFLYLLNKDPDLKALTEAREKDPCSFSLDRVREIHLLYTSLANSLKELGHAQVEQFLGEIQWQNISREDAVNFLAGLVVRQKKAVRRHR